jgi:hypothetical protein
LLCDIHVLDLLFDGGRCTNAQAQKLSGSFTAVHALVVSDALQREFEANIPLVVRQSERDHLLRGEDNYTPLHEKGMDAVFSNCATRPHEERADMRVVRPDPLASSELHNFVGWFESCFSAGTAGNPRGAVLGGEDTHCPRHHVFIRSHGLHGVWAHW